MMVEEEKSNSLGYNPEILELLEKTINPMHPEDGEVKIKLLGFGEISLVFEILEDKYPENAYKRLPIFSNEKQVTRHIKAYEEYRKILTEDIGLKIPPQSTAWYYAYTKKGKKRNDKITLYCIQKKLNPKTIGNKLLQTLSIDNVKQLVLLILKEMKKVWVFSKNNDTYDIGLDGQISNWAVPDLNIENPTITQDTKLIYIDTSTPLYRINGEEAMEPELFLTSAPSFLRWLLKLLFLEEVVNRYYDWRLVVIDLLANFYKEQKSEMIPEIIEVVNDFFESDAKTFNIEPITQNELESYYKSDKQIWQIFQGARKIDRWITTKILRKNYDFFLPGKIKR